ncbi:MAG: TraR/DksA family transcriptional regulator [Bdellovibrionota bacterium]
MKTRHLESLKSLSTDLVRETSGDVADQARQIQEETISLARREKLNQELGEINQALERIKNETYGVCEETGTPIEEKRLMALPWTRLSLEGAEIREMASDEQEDVGS